jgi:hypothetical protein
MKIPGLFSGEYLTLYATLVRREKAASVLIERNGDLSITSRGRRIHGHGDAIKV